MVTPNIEALFAVPGPFVSATAAQVCEVAKADFEAANAGPVFAPVPAAQLRATLHALAPLARSESAFLELSTEEQCDRAGNPQTVTAAIVPPIVAHFALVALALVEAESGEPGAPVVRGGGDVPPIDGKPFVDGSDEEEPDATRFEADLAILEKGDTPKGLGEAARALTELALNGSEMNWRDVSMAVDVNAQRASVRLIRAAVDELALTVEWHAAEQVEYLRGQLSIIDDGAQVA